MYWSREAEIMEVPALRRHQLARINDSLVRAAAARFYRERFSPVPPSIGRIEDIAQLTFTEKDDLRAGFPDGFLAVDRARVVRMHSSSGTTGNPTVVFHTRADIDTWADIVARCMYMSGARPGDVFQNTMGYGLFTGGLGFHYGAERLGALTIPIGPGNTKRQVFFMREFKTAVAHILPSYALRLAAFCDEAGIAPARDLALKIVYIGAEPHSDEMRREIEGRLNVRAYNSYGLSEICGPGVAFECPEQSGMHIWEDLVYPEIIDPASGRVLPEGEFGELVLTTLTREAMPLIRYRTRDLTRILPGPCPCGRTHRRIDRITGRSDDMLIINGVNIFPVQIEKAVMGVPGISGHYTIEIDERNYMDKLTVKIEVGAGSFSGALPDLGRLQKRITDDLKAELGVTPEVKLVEPGSLPVSEGKARRVYDNRPGRARG